MTDFLKRESYLKNVLKVVFCLAIFLWSLMALVIASIFPYMAYQKELDENTFGYVFIASSLGIFVFWGIILFYVLRFYIKNDIVYHNKHIVSEIQSNRKAIDELNAKLNPTTKTSTEKSN